MAAASVCPQGELQLLPTSPGDSRFSRWVWPRPLFRWLLLPWVLECVILCVPFKSVELSKVSPTNVQCQAFWGLAFSVYPCVVELDVGLRPLAPWGEPLQLWLTSHLCVTHPGVWVLTILQLCSSYLSRCGSFLKSFLLDFWFLSFIIAL